tara:strand:- start:12540 stop:12728 length:189 start_codon:yes stop_codon:yes gene_type:complete
MIQKNVSGSFSLSTSFVGAKLSTVFTLMRSIFYLHPDEIWMVPALLSVFPRIGNDSDALSMA